MARISQHKKLKPRVAVVGDGQTEKIYFADVKDTDRPTDLDLFPELPPSRGSYKNVLEKAVALAGSYNKVFAIIDFDTVIRDSLLEPYRTAKAKAEKKGVIVLENNPCFEIWPLLHFLKTTRAFTECDQVVSQLRMSNRIPQYQKSQRFLVSARLYHTYRHLLKTKAIPNAKHLETNRPKDNVQYPRAEIFWFFEWYLADDRIQRLLDDDLWPEAIR